MNTNLKKIIPLLGLAAFLATTPVIAYDDDDHMSDSHKAQHAVPPAQYPPGEDNLTFFIGAAYTYWVPYQAGMAVLYYDGGALPVFDGTPITNGVITPAMNGCSGFKVGLGANTNHDGWNVALQYTWFWNSPNMSLIQIPVDGGGVSTYECLWGIDDPIGAFQSRFANQFNRIDGVVDRAFYAGHYLAFRPWMGLLGAWDSQDLNFDSQTDGSETILFTEHTQSVRNRQTWWGIGPYAGVDSTYYFTNEWGLFLSSGVAILLANHDLHEQIYGYNAAGDIDATTYQQNMRTSFNNVEPMLEASLGLRWDSFWTDWALRVEIAWEMQTYFDHSGIYAYDQGLLNIGNSLNTYSMQGLTAGLRVNF